MVLFPFLPEPFSYHFLKNLASVVLGVFDGGAEEVGGAEDGELAELQQLLLLVVGLEAEGVARTAACTIQLADVGEQVGACKGEDDGAVRLEAEDIFVGVGQCVILGDKVTVDGVVKKLTTEDVDVTGAEWVHLEKACGYYFPKADSQHA